MRPGRRLGAVAGITGPVAFTAAWAVSSLLQAGHGAAEVQISGLAAPDARDPWIMITGFVVLGGCTVAFGAALHADLGGSGRAGPGPRLIQATGVATVAAGLLRRDRMLLTAPAGESWHNHAHDVVSALIYAALVAVPLLLARRMRGDRRYAALRWPLVAAGLVTAGLLVVFFARPAAAWEGALQRIAVTVPLAALAAVAARMLVTRPLSWRHGRSQGDSAGRRA
ncbi:MAG TPA: DUF998 domain-containing protein [Streptosporangiaceae bacterium]|nr:DUF998 domain-containing protein [Streptosporangiaceae bacterium]